MNATTFRRYVRYDFQAPVRLVADGENRTIKAQAYNLSQGGMFAGIRRILPRGTEVYCSLNLGGTNTTLRGRVAWIGEQSNRRGEVGKGVGIAFERPLPIDETRLQELTSRSWSNSITQRRPRQRDAAPMAATDRSGGARAAVLDESSRPSPARSETERRRAVSDRNPTLPYRGPNRGEVPAVSNRAIPRGFDAAARAAPLAKRFEPARGVDESISNSNGKTERFSVPFWYRIYARFVIATQRQRGWWLVIALGLVGSTAALLSAAFLFRPDLDRGVDTDSTKVRNTQSLSASVRADPVPASNRTATEPGSVPEAEPMVEPIDEPLSGPRVRAVGSRTIVVEIPLRGSLEGLDYYRLTKPDGISINLPRKPSIIRYGKHRIGRLGIRRIRIREFKRGAQVRVVAYRPFNTYEVTARTGLIRVTIRASRRIRDNEQ